MKMHLSKVITLALLLSISTILVNAGTFSASPIATFDVEFDFQIGGKQFSKGTYRISREKPTMLILENLTGSETKVLFGNPSEKNGLTDANGRLTFHRYGDQYFLRKITSPVINAKIGLSKDEEKARLRSGKKLAKVSVKGER